jgi:predicted TIM-barrel fold metal-dependent hydrolase
MLLHVTHATRYDYTPPVETAQHLAHLKPMNTESQRLVSHALTISPTPALREESADVYGNARAFFALASISPFDGMRGVREFEHLVKERGLNGLRVAALYNNLAASDRRYYPLYAKCVELDVPVRIYSTMNYANDRPYDLGHPRHLDQIAMDFPEMRIDAALSGWPWVNDLVGLMRRHPNLYCDTSAHHPQYFGVAGSGWEMFMQFGNTLLQDKIMVGFSKDSFGLTIPQSVAMYEKLPLKDKVIEKWLYGNAKEFLRC